MALKFNFEQSSLNRNLKKTVEKTMQGILMYALTKSKILESQMKRGRRWTDRTGRAKASLSSSVSKEGDGKIIRITLSHGVEYGVMLELKQEKKYAIIAPTIREESPRIIEGLRGIVSQIVVSE